MHADLGLTTTEAGGTATFTSCSTRSRPRTSRSPQLQRRDRGTVAPASLTFTTANWNAPQTVTVTGVDDAVATATSSTPSSPPRPSSADTNYNDLDPADVHVTNLDNDSGGGASEVLTGTCVGDGVGNRPITGLGFTPALVIVKATTTGQAVARTATMTGDVSKRWETGPL